MGPAISSSPTISAAPSSSGGRTHHAPTGGPQLGHGKRESSMSLSDTSPSHELQLFTNCSSTGPFHRVQSFRKRQLQCGHPTGSQVLPTNPLQHGLLPPWGHRSCQQTCPSACFPQGDSLFRTHPTGCRSICSTADLHGLQGDSCLTIACTMGCRETSALVFAASLPLSSSLTLVSA